MNGAVTGFLWLSILILGGGSAESAAGAVQVEASYDGRIGDYYLGVEGDAGENDISARFSNSAYLIRASEIEVASTSGRYCSPVESGLVRCRFPYQPAALLIDGGDGSDHLRFEDSIPNGYYGETLRGGAGSDILRGRRKGEALFGEEGSDLIRSGQGRDTLVGGEGSDSLLSGRGQDFVNAKYGPGDNDRKLVCGRGRDFLRLEPKDPRPRACERVRR